MERIELIEKYINEKHITTIAHEQYLNVLREYAPGTNLYMREMHFLVTAGENRPASISQLAEKLDVSLGAVSQMATKLEKKGLIYRTQDPEDKRRMMVNLTEEGFKLYCSHLEYDRKNWIRMSEIMKDFSDEEIERLILSEQVFRKALREV